MAKVVAIKIKEEKGKPQIVLEQAELIADFGLQGDIHAGKGIRQVSLFGLESWEKVKSAGIKGLCTEKFAENITVEGIALYLLPVGTRLFINDVILEITQVGKECHQICQIYKRGDDCVLLQEGIFAKVIKGGVISQNDEIIVDF